MSNHKISGVVITLNEEKHIKRCLDSLVPVVDEIVVVDSGSTDNTRSICEQYEMVRFVEHTWMGFSQTKNHANSLVQHSFILSLDADEELDQRVIKHIKQLKNDGLSGVYAFNRKNFYGNTWVKYCGWYPDQKVRLFDKSLAHWKGDFVHETLHIDKASIRHHIDGDINHFTIANEQAHQKTINQYARLAAQRCLNEGKKLNPLSSGLSTLSHFVKIYVLKLGFLHGLLGFRIAKNSALSKWLRYTYYKSLTS